MECYALAAFRSRQSVIRFDDALQSAGIRTQIVTTPHAVSMGCGLSVRFACSRIEQAVQTYKEDPLENFIGFYTAELVDGKIRISPYRV